MTIYTRQHLTRWFGDLSHERKAYLQNLAAATGFHPPHVPDVSADRDKMVYFLDRDGSKCGPFKIR